jgi:hypothetical protein
LDTDTCMGYNICLRGWINLSIKELYTVEVPKLEINRSENLWTNVWPPKACRFRISSKDKVQLQTEVEELEQLNQSMIAHSIMKDDAITQL